MAYFPVSSIGNHPFNFDNGSITSSILHRPNGIMGRVCDCTSTGAIRWELGATVSTMMTRILPETGDVGCNEFITTSWRIFA
jgi:hypothetical protein